MNQPLAFPQQAPYVPMFPLLTCADLAQLPPPTWLVEDICETDSQIMVFGPSGHGKSFAVLDLALCVESGLDWHGHAVKRGPVVYVTPEGGKALQQRVSAWCQHNSRPLPTQAFFILQAPQLADKKHLDGLIADIAHTTPTPALIILDTLARTAVGLEESSAKEMGIWIANAKVLQDRFQATVLVVHHTGRDAKEERGTTALFGALETSIKLMKKGTQIEVLCKKQKNALEFNPVYLTLSSVDLGAGVTAGVIADGHPPQQGNAGLAGCHYRLLRALAGCPSPTPLADWRAAVDADGQGPVPPKTFDNWRGHCEPEYILRVKKGVYQLTPVGATATAKQQP